MVGAYFSRLRWPKFLGDCPQWWWVCAVRIPFPFGAPGVGNFSDTHPARLSASHPIQAVPRQHVISVQLGLLEIGMLEVGLLEVGLLEPGSDFWLGTG